MHDIAAHPPPPVDELRGYAQAGRAWVAVDAEDQRLITFCEVAWNRPYYERLGFRALADDDLGPGLRGRRHAERTQGLDPGQRVGMRRDL